mgnify:CR=1 FL=1
MMVCRHSCTSGPVCGPRQQYRALCAPPCTLPQSPVHKVPRQLPAPRHWPAAFGHIIHVPLRFAAETVPPQQAGDLDLCQKLRSFSLPFTGAAGAWLCGSFVFSSIKRGCSFLTFWVESYKFISIIHPARCTRFVTEFGQSFHRGFTLFSYFSIQQCPHILGQGALRCNGAGMFLQPAFPAGCRRAPRCKPAPGNSAGRNGAPAGQCGHGARP